MKRILFVDDEPALLDALRSRLHRLRSKWDMVFVESGSRAITELESRPTDVVVTDMRMPGMDGAQLLSVVSQRWPDAVRIVLSGDAEQAQIMRLVPIAHQFVSKPCDTAQLENSIERCLQLQVLLNKPELRAVVGRMRKLPALPKTYQRVRDAMTREDVTIAQVAKIVGQDTAVTAKVLQLVNSAFFRTARRITKIEQAVTYLGFNAIRNLVMSAEVFSELSLDSIPGFDPEHLQVHVNSIAAAMGTLLYRSPLADDAILAGLLHDLGYWVLIQQCPSELSAALALANEAKIPMHEAETRVLGASHAEVGAYLLGLWGLPFSIVEAVARHHTPELVHQTNFDLLAALAVAHALAPHRDNVTPELREARDAPVDERYLVAVNAPFDWDEAAKLVNAAHA